MRSNDEKVFSCRVINVFMVSIKQKWAYIINTSILLSRDTFDVLYRLQDFCKRTANVLIILRIAPSDLGLCYSHMPMTLLGLYG